MKITRVVIACFRNDMYLTRSCVASVRYWYPGVEILLLKDLSAGDFSTREIETCWNVGIFRTERSVFGWPWSKLATVLSGIPGRLLFLDSDTLMLGPVLDMLAQHGEDFVVTGIKEPDSSTHDVNAHYIQMALMREFDPEYKYPGYAFNTGQMVVTGDLLSEDDFAPVVDLGPPITNRFPDMLRYGDQGALNYVVAKASVAGKLTVKYVNFWLWPGMPEVAAIDIEDIRHRRGIPFVLHWAGSKPVDFRRFVRYDLLEFFNGFYYSRVPGGSPIRVARDFAAMLIAKAKILKYRLLRKNYVAG